MNFSKLLVGMMTLTAATASWAVDKNLKGEVKLDGSSTVFPIAEAAAEEFQKEYPNVRVTVGLSGTGGGFKKFANGEIDISNASRKIKAEESKKAEANKITYLEIPLANDGISVVVNPANKFAQNISLEQLKKLWEPGSKVKTWKDLDAKWPAEAIKLYGPGADSGTFDFFTEHVMGTARLSRNDYNASEDDNVIVTGVTRDKNALAYFGFAYFVENEKALRALPIADKGAPIMPSPQSIEDGSYTLARPLLLYVNVKSAQKPEVKTFIEYILKNGATLAKDVGYVPLQASVYAEALKKFQADVASAKPSH